MSSPGTPRICHTRTATTVAQGHYDRDNLASAHVIVADPARDGGEATLAVRWARLLITNVEPQNIAAGTGNEGGPFQQSLFGVAA
jgi:hypothetical protein